MRSSRPGRERNNIPLRLPRSVNALWLEMVCVWYDRTTFEPRERIVKGFPLSLSNNDVYSTFEQPGGVAFQIVKLCIRYPVGDGGGALLPCR